MMYYNHNAVLAMQKRDIVKECLDFENKAYTELKNISDKRRKSVLIRKDDYRNPT